MNNPLLQRRRLMVQNGPNLPAIYQEVDWIRNVVNGSPIANIGNNPYIVDFHFEVPSGINNNKIILSVGYNSTRLSFYKNKLLCTNTGATWSFPFDTKIHCRIDGKNWTIDGVTKNGVEIGTSTQGGGYINFGTRYSNTYNSTFKYWGRVYIYNRNGIMTNLLVPCYRKSDYKVGFCDILSDNYTFHVGTNWQYGQIM